ncbi:MULTISPECIES: hypothetical protein [Aeromicrobium]|uniref:hypothetical protein n=1 Tax=Aeromicrobium TaxID=2040 RepID=UPI002579E193|nr:MULTISPECIES: hypothetical protein [Aeromicrobium]
MGQQFDNEDIITLEEMTDPDTGSIIFGLQESALLPAPRTGSALTMTDHGLVEDERPSQPVALPTDRFAGQGPVDWSAAEAQQAGGQVVSMIDGKLVTGQGDGPAQQVELPRDRFAAPDERFRAENAEVTAMAAAGAGSLLKLLQHTSQIRNWPADSPAGWVFTSRPTSHGDELTGLIEFNPSSGLYHFHFWRFDVRNADGRMGSVDLPAYLHAHPNLTAHGTHMYPNGRGGAVLCLSTNARGGLPSLTAVVFQAAKWADGMGEVVRGRRFPYRE